MATVHCPACAFFAQRSLRHLNPHLSPVKAVDSWLEGNTMPSANVRAEYDRFGWALVYESGSLRTLVRIVGHDGAFPQVAVYNEHCQAVLESVFEAHDRRENPLMVLYGGTSYEVDEEDDHALDPEEHDQKVVDEVVYALRLAVGDHTSSAEGVITGLERSKAEYDGKSVVYSDSSGPLAVVLGQHDVRVFGRRGRPVPLAILALREAKPFPSEQS